MDPSDYDEQSPPADQVVPKNELPHLYHRHDKGGVVINDTTYESLKKWLERKDLHIWSYNSNKTKCLGFGDDACIVSSRILKALMHIHNQNKCHGDLLNGITISFDNDVKLVGHTPQEDISKGILKDLEDFKEFIEMVILDHPIEANLDMPVAVDLFYETFKHFPKEEKRFKDYLFFIYNNPLFWNGNQRYLFSVKMWELKWAKLQYFNAFFKLNGPLTDMTNWFNGIPAQSLLDEVLRHGHMFSRKYQFNDGVLPFMRDVYSHCKEQDETLYRFSRSVLVIEQMLYEAVPEACPKIFFEVVMIYLSVARKKFGDIVSFLKEGSLVFHLQE